MVMILRYLKMLGDVKNHVNSLICYITVKNIIVILIVLIILDIICLVINIVLNNVLKDIMLI